MGKEIKERLKEDFIMGQRSQIYIRYNVNYTMAGKTENYKGLIARYYQWNYCERMISRARGIIEAIKDEYIAYSFMWNDKRRLEKLSRICDTNFDMRDIVMSGDIIKEVVDEWNCNCDYIFNQDNNDGQLLIDVTNDGIKYAFIPYYNKIKVLDCRNYLVWDSKTCYKEWQWSETETPKAMDEQTKEYTLNNIDYISKNATLMTKEEVEEFVGADYSYLFEQEKAITQ